MKSILDEIYDKYQVDERILIVTHNFINKLLLFGYSNNGDFMEEKMIEVVIKEFDSERDSFPSSSSLEGEKLIQTVRKETIIDDDDD